MSPKISRRELLKSGAKAAAALSVLPALTTEADAQRARGAGRAAGPKGGALARLDLRLRRHEGGRARRAGDAVRDRLHLEVVRGRRAVADARRGARRPAPS